MQDGQIKREQRVDLVHDRLVKFAQALSVEEEVVVEATGNSAAVERVLRPFVKRVVIANPRMVRAIAYAHVKTDKIDATIPKSSNLHDSKSDSQALMSDGLQSLTPQTVSKHSTTDTECAYAQPAFTSMKLRKAALKAGAPRAYGKAGPSRDYWIKEIREREARLHAAS